MITKLLEAMKQQGVCTEENEKVYRYGLELFLNGLVNTLLLLLLGAFFHKLPEAVTFIIAYRILKKDSGGYHADSHLGCVVQFNLVFLGILLLDERGAWNSAPYLLGGCVLSLLIIWAFAPVVALNKEMTPEEVQEHRKKVKRNSLVFCLLLLFVVPNLQKLSNFGRFTALGYCMAGLTVIMGWGKNRYILRRRLHHVENSSL